MTVGDFLQVLTSPDLGLQLEENEQTYVASQVLHALYQPTVPTSSPLNYVCHALASHLYIIRSSNLYVSHFSRQVDPGASGVVVYREAAALVPELLQLIFSQRAEQSMVGVRH